MFSLDGFLQLAFLLMYNSLGRQDFCGCVLSRDSVGSRDIHTVKPYLCHVAICCVEETLLNPENNIFLNFVPKKEVSHGIRNVVWY